MSWEGAGVIVAIVLGLSNLFLEWSTRRREVARQDYQLGLEDRMAAIEQDRREEELVSRRIASIAVGLQRLKNSNGALDLYLVLHNNGPAAARNVAVEPVAVWTPGDLLQLMVPPGTLPVDLEPGEEYPIRAHAPYGTAEVQDLRLRWDDDVEPNHEVRRRLSVAWQER